MSLNNIRAVGDDRQWKDEVERELKSLLDIIKYGKITIRSAGTTTGGGGGGGTGAGADAISATLPATYDNTTYIVGVDQDAFDRIGLLDYAEFDTTYSLGSTDVGILAWSQEFETLETKLDPHVTLQFGQEHLVRVKNASASTAIPIMSVVMFAGATGDTVTVSPAVTDGSVSEDYIVGVTTEEIPADGFGFVTQYGFITGVDTSAYTLGNILYADPAVAGGFTTTQPSAPNLKLPLAAVTRVNASSGRILVRTFVGKKLFELHDVQIVSITDGELLLWSNTNSRWENKTAAEASLLTTSTTLDDLSGVVITTPASDQVLKYDGTNWVNAASPGGGGGTVTSITAGTNLTGGTITTSGTIALQTSPALSGTPTAPTAAVTVNSTQIATTAFVKSLVTYGTSRTGYYDVFSADITAGTILTKDLMYLTAAKIGMPTLVDSLTIVCSTAGGSTSVTRLGIYDWAGNLIRDAGTVQTNTTGNKTITGLAQTLSPGYYFFAVCGQVAATQPIIRTYSQSVNSFNPAVSISSTGANRGISVATVTGALPATLGASFNDTNQIYRVIYGVL